MTNRLLGPLCLLLATAVFPYASIAQKKTIDQRVDSVLRLMTLEEKTNQMVRPTTVRPTNG